MDIRTSLDGLKSLLGVNNTPAQPSSGPRSNATAAQAPRSDRATLSSAGSEVQLTAGEDGVRTDKVASVQAALAAGTYNVRPQRSQPKWWMQ